MNVVLFHRGDPLQGNPDHLVLPKHIKHCISQIRYTNPELKIYFLTNLNIEQPPDQNISIVNINEFEAPDISKYFAHDIPEHVQLWHTAVLRLFYIEKFLEKYNVSDIIHFDNDVLIFSNLKDLSAKFKKFNFLITPHFETEYVFGFSYIKNNKSLTPINNSILELVNLPFTELQARVDHKTPHEMRLLNYVNTSNNNKYIDHLPVVVEGPGSDNFDIFETIFDPSSYGKHVAGSHCLGPHNKYYVSTPNFHGTELHHYAGQQINSGKIKVDFDGKYPFLTYNKKKYMLANLHIHDKNLKDFTTYDA